MSQHRKEKKKRRAERKRRETRQGANEGRVLENFLNLFGDQSEEILTLASQGASPEEISNTLDVPLETVSQFIENFASLPGGIDRQLLRIPSLLTQKGSVTSLVKAAIRAARAEQRQKPW